MKKLPFVKAADVEGEFRNPPRTSKLLLAPKFGGVKNLSMGMNITEVDSMIPDHTHEESEEVLFLISGRAKLVLEGEGEFLAKDGATMPAQTGDVLIFDISEPHGVRAKTNMRVIVMIAPPI